MNQNTISARYQRAFEILSKLPWVLLGLCFLTPILAGYVASAVVTWILPIIALPVGLTLGAGLCGVFLKAVRDEKYDLMTLLEVFSSWNALKRVAGGMCWMLLVVYLWSVIPALVLTLIFGIGTAILSAVFDTAFFAVVFGILMVFLWVAAAVIAVIKSVEYSFTPYILVSRPEIRATEAIKESSRLTKGIRASIFVSMIIPSLVFAAVMGILGALSALPLIGWLFGACAFVVNIAFSVIYSLFMGLVTAGFYNEAQKTSADVNL